MKTEKTGDNSPLGIFDSGIGGLTVAHAISKLLPSESFIYFGDTAHLPYGEKSPEAINRYATKIADFLVQKKCKMIVIACNTASSLAFETVKKHAPGIKVINVIDPVAELVANLFHDCRIGVIGTKATIKSDVYKKKIHHLNPTIEVTSQATPLLAPMIEEGFFNNNISRTIINSYLSKGKLKNIDALILACTHYPLIRAEIEEYYRNKTTVIDSAEIVAMSVKSSLLGLGLMSDRKIGRHHFYVSDYTSAFEKSTRYFFKGKLKLELKEL